MSPTVCGVPECEGEASIMRRPWPIGAVAPWKNYPTAVTYSATLSVVTGHLPCSAALPTGKEFRMKRTVPIKGDTYYYSVWPWFMQYHGRNLHLISSVILVNYSDLT
jgi:hypothetical protein